MGQQVQERRLRKRAEAKSQVARAAGNRQLLVGAKNIRDEGMAGVARQNCGPARQVRQRLARHPQKGARGSPQSVSSSSVTTDASAMTRSAGVRMVKAIHVGLLVDPQAGAASFQRRRKEDSKASE